MPYFANGRNCYGTALAQIGDKIYHFGYGQTLSVLHLNTWVWEDLFITPFAVSILQATLVDDKIFIFAHDPADQNNPILLIFDPILDTFDRQPARVMAYLPAQPVYADFRREIITYGARHVAVDNSLLSGLFNYVAETFAFDVDTMESRRIVFKGRAPEPRSEAAALLVQYNMYIFGGRSPVGEFDDLWIADLSVVPTWSRPRLVGIRPGPLFLATLHYIKGKVILYGGKHEGVRQHQPWMLDKKASEWRSPSKRNLLIQGKRPVAVYACHGLQTNGGALFITGGGLVKMELLEA